MLRFLPDMRSLARFMLVFPLGLWVGGIIFFSFVVAPALFRILPNPAMAGNVVNVTLADLHRIGIACGAVFLAATFIVEPPNAKGLRTLAAVMLVLTAISLFGIAPQMERIRASVGGSIEALPHQDAGRAAFDRLHQLSVGLEGVVLLAGVVSFAVLSREK
jgi:uncharacterized membrane protein